ncbi:hypothetical protein DFR74_12342 [Nocardia puris]|uniref:Haloacid dehalogenase-like hydrolase n=1 Tax=Nocardia puris TaxID=208602 RepID=A0A366CXT5_9NOCA|nr:hypothetical protein DFR74_12342 [Nocardia puris]
MTEPARTAAEYRAVVFDMDGVVTGAAAVHANVWTALSGADLPALGGAVRSRPGGDRSRSPSLTAGSRDACIPAPATRPCVEHAERTPGLGADLGHALPCDTTVPAGS